MLEWNTQPGNTPTKRSHASAAYSHLVTVEWSHIDAAL